MGRVRGRAMLLLGHKETLKEGGDVEQVSRA